HHLRPLLSPDGRRLLLRGLLTGQVWDVATGNPVTGYLTLRDAVPSLGGLRAAAAFSPDGTFLLTADADSGAQPNGLARVWETATGKPISPLLVHEQDVVTAAFGPGGDRVVTGSADATARIWDVRTGKQLTPPMRHRTRVALCRFSPDGRRIVTF